jgi:hypothetical protein
VLVLVLVLVSNIISRSIQGKRVEFPLRSAARNGGFTPKQRQGLQALTRSPLSAWSAATTYNYHYSYLVVDSFNDDNTAFTRPSNSSNHKARHMHRHRHTHAHAAELFALLSPIYLFLLLLSLTHIHSNPPHSLPYPTTRQATG